MSFLIGIINFLKIDDTKPAINRKRYMALTRQAPLMYFILTVNIATLVYPHIGTSPDALTILIPIIFCSIFAIRSFRFLKASSNILTDTEIVKQLNLTVFFTIFLSALITSWTVALFLHADEIMTIHIVFFLYITLFSCIICLLHVMQAAITLMIIIMGPLFFYLMSLNNEVLEAMAINGLLVSTGILFLLKNHYKNFVHLIKQTKMLKNFNAKNIELANKDSLTSLPNRRNFFTMLDTLTNQSAQNSSRKLIVGLLDLDGFKRINDIFGHRTGDDLLIKTSERLRDTLAERIYLARLGGDEFGLIIDNPKDIENIYELGLKICKSMSSSFLLNDNTINISATIGFVEYPSMAKTTQDIFERADYALCYSKLHSKGKPVIFSEAHKTIIKEISTIEHQLLEADLESELSIMFQPIIDIWSNETIGFEALARWNNSVLGYVRPDLFIRSAEQTGTICKLTSILLAKALKLATQWPADTYMSFNLSIYDLSSSEIIHNIIDIMKKSGFPAQNIVFEVTETAVMHNFDKTNEALNLLKAQGAKIALDDFGTGYSSLSYVQRMPLDRLKIDRSFITQIDSDKNTRNIVRTIINLCENLNLDCIIEGVETESQLIIVKEIGAKYVQGYYFSRPLTSEATMKYLEDNSENTEYREYKTKP